MNTVHGGGEPTRRREPIRVRASGRTIGMGILLDDSRVLTCAHVVPAVARPVSGEKPGPWTIVVEFPGGDEDRRRFARVTAGGWKPRRKNNDHVDVGDLALLELREPFAGESEIVLYRVSPRHETDLYAYGFPDSGPGRWASVTGRGWSGELFQIDPDGPQWIERGFSGGAVEDTDGRVVGMVMSRLGGDDSSGIGWMMPVDTIVRHLPQLESLARGVPRAPRGLWGDSRASPEVREQVRSLTDWLAEPVSAAVTITGDPETRREVIRLIIAPTVSAPGSGTRPVDVDLALDVARQTTDRVADQIAERLGMPTRGRTELLKMLRGEGTDLGVVIDNLDTAADPDELLSELVRPLADLGPGTGQVIIGSGTDLPPVGRNSRSLNLSGRGVPARLDRLDELVTRLRIAEDRVSGVDVRFTGIPARSPKAARLRFALTGLRLARPEEAAARLPEVEATAGRALRRAEATAANEAVRQELRERLRAYRAMAEGGGQAESSGLLARAVSAVTTLESSPCDLARCREAVEEYRRELWERLGLGPEEET